MKNLLTLELKDNYYLEDTNILTQIGYALENGTVFKQYHEKASEYYKKAYEMEPTMTMNLMTADE